MTAPGKRAIMLSLRLVGVHRLNRHAWQPGPRRQRDRGAEQMVQYTVWMLRWDIGCERYVLVAQGIERSAADAEAAGSNPVEDA